MSKRARKAMPDTVFPPQLRGPTELDARLEAGAAEPDAFLREFRRRMAAQGMIVRLATAGPGWEPPVSLDIPADELSGAVVRARGEGA